MKTGETFAQWYRAHTEAERRAFFDAMARVGPKGWPATFEELEAEQHER